jgi:hypothetical protein
MLAVDRKEKPSPTLLRGYRELAGRDEALLVRERQRHAALERPQRRANAGEADDGVEHDVGVASLQEHTRISADLDVRDPVLRCEIVQRGRPRLEGAKLELGVRGDDLDRLPADRSCRPEDCDASHARKDA